MEHLHGQSKQCTSPDLSDGKPGGAGHKAQMNSGKKASRFEDVPGIAGCDDECTSFSSSSFSYSCSSFSSFQEVGGGAVVVGDELVSESRGYRCGLRNNKFLLGHPASGPQLGNWLLNRPAQSRLGNIILIPHQKLSLIGVALSSTHFMLHEAMLGTLVSADHEIVFCATMAVTLLTVDHETPCSAALCL